MRTVAAEVLRAGPSARQQSPNRDRVAHRKEFPHRAAVGALIRGDADLHRALSPPRWSPPGFERVKQRADVGVLVLVADEFQVARSVYLKLHYIRLPRSQRTVNAICRFYDLQDEGLVSLHY